MGKHTTDTIAQRNKIQRNKNSNKYAAFKRKLAHTAVYFLCFTIGRNIPIPYLSGSLANSSAINTPLLNASNIATGGDFFSPSLFSLGLGPWMLAAILWRFLLIGKIAQKHKYSERATNYARAGLMVVLAVIQAINMVNNYTIASFSLGPLSGVIYAKILVVIIMVVGSLVVVWLANRNQEKGLGGMTIFIIYQIIVSIVNNISALPSMKLDSSHRQMLITIGAACLIILVVSIIAYNSELRLHVNKIAIDSGYIGKSYLPISLNPAGASPVMYGLTLMMLPQYLISLLTMIFPNHTQGLSQFFSNWVLTNPIGFYIYIVLLFGLTIFFGLFTVNPGDLSEQMKNAGDYFDFISPGKDTKHYIRKRVIVLSILSGIFLVIFTGLPLYFLEVDQSYSFFFLLPGTMLMLVSLLMGLKEEINDILVGTKYSSIFLDK